MGLLFDFEYLGTVKAQEMPAAKRLSSTYQVGRYL